MLYLIRGLPGSGKSRLAALLGFTVYEADQYFCKSGTFQYDSSKIGLAHMECFSNVTAHLKRGYGESCTVANTFSTVSEYQAYLALCYQTGHQYQIIECHGHPAWKNVHQVPEAMLTKMINRWEQHH